MANRAETNRIAVELDDLIEAAPEDQKKIDARRDREIPPLVAASWEMRVELAEARATTMEGFRAKARVVQAFNDCAPG